MCCVSCWNALPLDILMAPSVVPFRSLPKCPLLCEEYPALLSDLFLSMALITLQYTIPYFLLISYVACLSPRECKLLESRDFYLCFHHLEWCSINFLLNE